MVYLPPPPTLFFDLFEISGTLSIGNIMHIDNILGIAGTGLSTLIALAAI